LDSEQASALTATQLQTVIMLYEKIQQHVFRLMATDSVPKFIKTTRFTALRNFVEDYESGENESSADQLSPTLPPGLDQEEEVGRAYMTVSQTANEKMHKQANGSGLVSDANLSSNSLSGSRGESTHS